MYVSCIIIFMTVLQKKSLLSGRRRRHTLTGDHAALEHI